MQLAVVVMGVIVVVMVVPVTMPVMVIVTVAMIVVMIVVMIVGEALDLCISASANRAHQTTSKSLIRISSPPVGISFPPPQSGQGSSRSAISTSLAQS